MQHYEYSHTKGDTRTPLYMHMSLNNTVCRELKTRGYNSKNYYFFNVAHNISGKAMTR